MEDSENKEVKTKRDELIERLKQKRSDLNTDDDEALYGSVLNEMDEISGNIDGYKKNEDMLVGAFEKNPKIAQLFIEMANGENPLLYLVENFGDEFREALENPDVKDQIVERQNKYIERMAKNKQLEEESKANLTASIDALSEAQTELGCSDEDAAKAFEIFMQIIDDAIVDKVGKDTWLMFLKGVKHDVDVEQAAHEAEIRGKNTKIEDLKAKKSVPADIPPQIGGQGDMPKSKRIEIDGALSKYGGDNQSIWDK